MKSKSKKRMPGKEMDRLFEKIGEENTAFVLPQDASLKEKTKYELCQALVVFLREAGMKQKDLASFVGTNESMISRAVNYKIWLLDTDNLLDWVGKVYPNYSWKNRRRSGSSHLRVGN